MTKEEFERKYYERSGITKEQFDEYYVVLPCSCQYEECGGWAVVSNNQLAIDAHNRLYR